MATCGIAAVVPNKSCSPSDDRRRRNRRRFFPGASAAHVPCGYVSRGPLDKAGRGSRQFAPVPPRSPRHSRDLPCNISRNECTRKPTHLRTKADRCSSLVRSHHTRRLIVGIRNHLSEFHDTTEQKNLPTPISDHWGPKYISPTAGKQDERGCVC